MRAPRKKKNPSLTITSIFLKKQEFIFPCPLAPTDLFGDQRRSRACGGASALRLPLPLPLHLRLQLQLLLQQGLHLGLEKFKTVQYSAFMYMTEDMSAGHNSKCTLNTLVSTFLFFSRRCPYENKFIAVLHLH